MDRPQLEAQVYQKSAVTHQGLADDPEPLRAEHEWDPGRRQLREQKARGEVKLDEWQRDYFQGRDPIRRAAAASHMIKANSPQFHYGSQVLTVCPRRCVLRGLGSRSVTISRLHPLSGAIPSWQIPLHLSAR
jgi:hypothetical protein